MVRSIVGVVVGYIVMMCIVIGGLFGAAIGMGLERVFKSGSYEPTMAWWCAWGAADLIAAIVGGLVCTTIAKNCKAGLGLIGLMLVLWGVFTIPGLLGEKKPHEVRTPDVKLAEAMPKLEHPTWEHIANPVIGIVGVMMGAALAGKKKAPAPGSGM